MHAVGRPSLERRLHIGVKPGKWNWIHVRKPIQEESIYLLLSIVVGAHVILNDETIRWAKGAPISSFLRNSAARSAATDVSYTRNAYSTAFKFTDSHRKTSIYTHFWCERRTFVYHLSPYFRLSVISMFAVEWVDSSHRNNAHTRQALNRRCDDVLIWNLHFAWDEHSHNSVTNFIRERCEAVYFCLIKLDWFFIWSPDAWGIYVEGCHSQKYAEWKMRVKYLRWATQFPYSFAIASTRHSFMYLLSTWIIFAVGIGIEYIDSQRILIPKFRYTFAHPCTAPTQTCSTCSR